jgi:hypothetical protein
MRLKLFCFTFFLSLTAFAESSQNIRALKREIFQAAESFKGQGDADGTKQKKLEILVGKLLKANPQPPLNQRLHLLYGAWQQIWGPYEYRNNDRGVDPTLDVNNIFQVVFEDGYYYNVNPSLDSRGKPNYTVLLRGEFSLLQNSGNVLRAKFTDLRRIPGLPSAGLRFQDLPQLSEEASLPGQRNALPPFLVRWFFGGGYLNEVYTDHDLRITFGSGANNAVQNYIYIMKRVKK